jgi:hypothetical protein
MFSVFQNRVLGLMKLSFSCKKPLQPLEQILDNRVLSLLDFIIIIIIIKVGHTWPVPIQNFNFRNLWVYFGRLVRLLRRGISPTQALYVHGTTQHRKTHTHTSKPRAVFESMIPVFERSKTVRALDRAAIGTGLRWISVNIFLAGRPPPPPNPVHGGRLM